MLKVVSTKFSKNKFTTSNSSKSPKKSRYVSFVSFLIFIAGQIQQARKLPNHSNPLKVALLTDLQPFSQHSTDVGYADSVAL
jgi:hypothetical protein